MKFRTLNLETDFLENSDEPFQFPEDTMNEEEFNERFDELMKSFF